MAEQWSVDAMNLELSSGGSFLDLIIAAGDEIEEPEQASTSRDIVSNVGNSGVFSLELQEANNISKAAYKEIMTMAFEAKTWVEATPALGSLEEFLQMFRSPPPPGMRVECSIACAVVPVAPDVLVSIMVDAGRWASSFSHIVSRGSGYIPTGVLPKLRMTNSAIKSLLMVNAEFRLPTPLVQTRKFCFLRYLREIIPNVWAIVDVSSDYFPDTSGSRLEQICRRRPSGLIVRQHGIHSQVIWIENVEVPEGQSQNGVFSGIIDSNSAFSAKNWVNSLIWRMKRNDSRFRTIKIQVNQKADTHLLSLSEAMRMGYLDLVNEIPNEGKWVTLSNKDIRILRNVTVDRDDKLGLNMYVAVTSFRLQAKPISVFDFLFHRNMDIQWPRLQYVEEPQEVIRFASEDGSNRISLLQKVVSQNESMKGFEYLLQEASRDGFCSFIVSSAMNELDVNTSLFLGRPGDALLHPSGFAIMPDGPDGLHSNASLVTIAMQRELNVPETDQAIVMMCGFINAIINDTFEGVSTGSSASR